MCFIGVLFTPVGRFCLSYNGPICLANSFGEGENWNSTLYVVTYSFYVSKKHVDQVLTKLGLA